MRNRSRVSEGLIKGSQRQEQRNGTDRGRKGGVTGCAAGEGGALVDEKKAGRSQVSIGSTTEK